MLYIAVMRFVFPVLAILILYKCARLLFGCISKKTVFAVLCSNDGFSFDICHQENSIGRSRFCDLVIPGKTISRQHAVISKRGDDWFIFDTGSAAGVVVNGDKITNKSRLDFGDKIELSQHL